MLLTANTTVPSWRGGTSASMLLVSGFTSSPAAVTAAFVTSKTVDRTARARAASVAAAEKAFSYVTMRRSEVPGRPHC